MYLSKYLAEKSVLRKEVVVVAGLGRYVGEDDVGRVRSAAE